MDKSEIRDIAETLMGNGITNMADETGDFDVNMNMIKDGYKIWKDLEPEQEKEPDEEEIRRKKLQNDILEEELKAKKEENNKLFLDREHELFMQNEEKKRSNIEIALKSQELENNKKKEAWDRGLKIAGIAAPIIGAGITALTGIILFNKKSELVNETIKLNTLLQEKGYISGLNNSKVISDQFNNLLK